MKNERSTESRPHRSTCARPLSPRVPQKEAALLAARPEPLPSSTLDSHSNRYSADALADFDGNDGNLSDNEVLVKVPNNGYALKYVDVDRVELCGQDGASVFATEDEVNPRIRQLLAEGTEKRIKETYHYQQDSPKQTPAEEHSDEYAAYLKASMGNGAAGAGGALTI